MNTISGRKIVVKHISHGTIHEEYAVKKDSHLTLVYVVSGASDLSLSPSIHLVGEHASATLVGLVTGKGNARIHINTLQHHKARNTTSNLLVKSVLSDSSACIYEGGIVVDKSAQKTDAYQRNENLLLDEHTQATSSPALEILANDVRCTHGAVVKTFDENEVWYLLSRGIHRKDARAMIASGFLTSAYSRIENESDRHTVEQQVALIEKGESHE